METKCLPQGLVSDAISKNYSRQTEVVFEIYQPRLIICLNLQQGVLFSCYSPLVTQMKEEYNYSFGQVKWWN